MSEAEVFKVVKTGKSRRMFVTYISIFLNFPMLLDTIRDAILVCTQKLKLA